MLPAADYLRHRQPLKFSEFSFSVRTDKSKQMPVRIIALQKRSFKCNYSLDYVMEMCLQEYWGIAIHRSKLKLDYDESAAEIFMIKRNQLWTI